MAERTRPEGETWHHCVLVSGWSLHCIVVEDIRGGGSVDVN